MLKVSHFQMLGKFLCMNSPVTILTSMRLDWSWCVTRKQNQAKAKPFKFIFKSFLRRSKTGLSRRFPIDWLTLDKRKVDIWDSPPVPNLVFSPPPPEFVRAGVGGGPVYADVKRKSSCIDNNGGFAEAEIPLYSFTTFSLFIYLQLLLWFLFLPAPLLPLYL